MSNSLEYTVIYTITVLDDRNPEVPAYQRTPGIFTDFVKAVEAVKTNDCGISENGTNKYAVIEKTRLNQILPMADEQTWFEWDTDREEYVFADTPSQYIRVFNFGIG